MGKVRTWHPSLLYISVALGVCQWRGTVCSSWSHYHKCFAHGGSSHVIEGASHKGVKDPEEVVSSVNVPFVLISPRNHLPPHSSRNLWVPYCPRAEPSSLANSTHPPYVRLLPSGIAHPFSTAIDHPLLLLPWLTCHSGLFSCLSCL